MIHNGRICQISDNIQKEGIRTIEAGGLYVMQGLFDMHVHLRDPGFTEKEDIFSGTSSAICGGFTKIACMANTNPVNDNPEITKYILDKAHEISKARVYPISSITKNLDGKELVDFEKMKSAGAVAFSEDGFSVENNDILRRAMERIKALDMVVISHCEDKKISKNGVIRDGAVARKLSLPTIDPKSEIKMVKRDIELAKKAGCKLHLTHISTKESVALIKKAKKEGVNITADVTPHHLFLSVDDILSNDANFKMNPPLGSKEDKSALLNGIIDGTIDVVASDHAPHTPQEKSQGFLTAPFGVIGLETTLPLIFQLVFDNKITINQLVNILSVNPAKILNIPANDIIEGAIADLIIFDPNFSGKFKADNFVSKSKNSPFIGRNYRGKVLLIVVNGNVIYDCSLLTIPSSPRKRGSSL